MQRNLFLSSIGKKLLVALAGGFLMVFLLVHLGINLLLLAGDGGALFNEASHFMGTNWLIQKMQYMLAFGFVLHIVVAIALTIKNRIARGQRYQVFNSSKTSFFSKYMFHTGMIIFGFLLVHLFHFFYKMKFTDMAGYESDYHLVSALFEQWSYSVLYLVWFVFLGFHLYHAFQSAFQTLGFNHNRYFGAVKVAGFLYALVVCGGFSIIPLYFLIG